MGTLCFNFLFLNLTITLSRFVIRWHACRSSGTTSWPINDKALQIVSSRTLSRISCGMGFNSRVSFLWFCALLTAFLSNWMIREYNRGLHFLVTTKSEKSSLYFFEKLSNLSVSSVRRAVISESFTSCYISSYLLRFSIWHLVKNHFSQDIKRFRKIKKELRAKQF